VRHCENESAVAAHSSDFDDEVRDALRLLRRSSARRLAVHGKTVQTRAAAAGGASSCSTTLGTVGLQRGLQHGCIRQDVLGAQREAGTMEFQL
jgi:hypothetical protein